MTLNSKVRLRFGPAATSPGITILANDYRGISRGERSEKCALIGGRDQHRRGAFRDATVSKLYRQSLRQRRCRGADHGFRASHLLDFRYRETRRTPKRIHNQIIPVNLIPYAKQRQQAQRGTGGQHCRHQPTRIQEKRAAATQHHKRD